MYYVYIMLSNKLQKFYVRSTQDVELRWMKHNRRKSTFTRTGMPWNLIQEVQMETSTSAMELENQIKKRGIKPYLEDKNLELKTKK